MNKPGSTRRKKQLGSKKRSFLAYQNRKKVCDLFQLTNIATAVQTDRAICDSLGVDVEHEQEYG